MYTAEKTGHNGRLLSGAVCGMGAILITLILMMGASALIASGKLSPEKQELVVTICAFLGSLLGMLLLRPRKGSRGLLLAGSCALVYALLLLILELSTGAQSLLSPNFVKLCLSSVLGSVLGVLPGKEMRGSKKGRGRRKEYR